MRVHFALIFLLIFAGTGFSQSGGAVILRADFDDANLDGWRTAGDVCVAPAFCAGSPTGRYWVALSTNNAMGDSITMCGYSSLEGMQTVLRSPDLPLPFKPSRIKIDFSVKFLTNESTVSDLGNDSFVVRLLTKGGTVPIFSLDDAGPSPESKNLKIRGDTQFRESACYVNWRYESGLLHVSYYRFFREPFRSAMASGPIALEFSLMNYFDQDFDSAVVLDDVQLRILP